MIKTECNTRVLYAHTDKMGIVNNSRYLEYFEMGRNDMLRKFGYPYSLLESKDYALPVFEVFCKYFNPARYDDVIRIISYLKTMPTVRIKIDYQIYSGKKILVEGYTLHSFINLKKLKPVKPPEDFINLFKEFFL
jgi:acyl-CoA thioester hydrolase